MKLSNRWKASALLNLAKTVTCPYPLTTCSDGNVPAKGQMSPSSRALQNMMNNKQNAERLRKAQLKQMLEQGDDPELGQKAAKDLFND